MESSGLRLAAPAKINLTLEVLAKRPDGYHGIRSLMVPLALSDEITIEPSPGGFSFTCDDQRLTTPDNLVVRAFHAIYGTNENAQLPSVKVTLGKQIPTEAGLGGGSSDATAILLAAISGALGPVSANRDWLALARSLGSDVPFFLTQTGALVEGTGERVTAVGTLPQWHAIVIKPPVAVSTAGAYAMLDGMERASRPRNDSISLRALTALQRGDFAEVTACLSNDFHDVIITKEPMVAQAIDVLRTAGATNALLAGSGSCVFTLVEYQDEAERIREKLSLPVEFKVFLTKFQSSQAWKTNTEETSTLSYRAT